MNLGWVFNSLNDSYPTVSPFLLSAHGVLVWGYSYDQPIHHCKYLHWAAVPYWIGQNWSYRSYRSRFDPVWWVGFRYSIFYAQVMHKIYGLSSHGKEDRLYHRKNDFNIVFLILQSAFLCSIDAPVCHRVAHHLGSIRKAQHNGLAISSGYKMRPISPDYYIADALLSAAMQVIYSVQKAVWYRRRYS